MLANISSSPLRSTHGRGEEKSREDEGEILLDDINFDDIFVGFDVHGSCGDILPDLEIDPVDDIIFADLISFSSGSGEEEEEESVAGRDHGGNNIAAAVLVPDRKELDSCREYLSQNHDEVEEEEEEDGSVLLVSAGAAAESAAERSAASSGEIRSGQKQSTTATATKGSHGRKKKAKVDWTPELHRRFVQAVEQLGVDKAVPSRILELMGIDCLTRHNIASHLQKYRSHRKHLLAREAEAASWSQRRQMYAAGGGGGVMKMKKHSWQAPPVAGFPPPPPSPQMRPLIRVVPLHVWGHPSASERPQLVPVWPRHLTPPPPPQPWLPSRPPPLVGLGPVPPPMPHDYPNSYWHPPHYQMALTQGMPFFPPQAQLLLPAMRFQAPPVPSIHPHDHPLLIRPPAPSSSHISAAATTVNPTSPSTVFDAHPSNEKIDAAIGDVLAKPWSALPLGLKPPSLESVMVELQRQGVAKVPPSSTSGG